jgi:hypothetical protein
VREINTTARYSSKVDVVLYFISFVMKNRNSNIIRAVIRAKGMPERGG